MGRRWRRVWEGGGGGCGEEVEEGVGRKGRRRRRGWGEKKVIHRKLYHCECSGLQPLDRHYSKVAEWLKHWIADLEVPGSSPTWQQGFSSTVCTQTSPKNREEGLPSCPSEETLSWRSSGTWFKIGSCLLKAIVSHHCGNLTGITKKVDTLGVVPYEES